MIAQYQFHFFKTKKWWPMARVVGMAEKVELLYVIVINPPAQYRKSAKYLLIIYVA